MSGRLAGKAAAFFDRIPAKWQFGLFIGATLAASLALTVVSYTMYRVTGTAQLDLSRPGYKQALSQVSPANTDDSYTYSGTGALDAAALTEFKTKYDAIVNKTDHYGVFDPGALSDEQLNLTDPSIVGPR